MDITVGIGECVISDNKDDILKTFSLGSCIAVVAYSPKRMVAGLAHIALPCSSTDYVKSKYQPAHFVDTGIPLLLNKLKEEYGCFQNELQISIIGGSETMQQIDIFKIGKRNINAVKRVLSQNNIQCYRQDTGGAVSRNLEIDVASGTMKIDMFPIPTSHRCLVTSCS